MLPANPSVLETLHENHRKITVAMLADFPYRDEDLYSGGVMQANYRLVKALARLDLLDLYVLAPTANVASEEIHTEGAASIIFYPPNHAGYDTILLYRGLRTSLSQIVARIQPDLVHAQAVPAYVLAALQMKVPHLVTLHGVYRNELKVLKSRMSLKMQLVSFVMRRLEDHNLRRIQNLIAITSQIESLVKSYSPRVKVFRINNAIDDRFFALQDENSSPIVLFIGWVSYRKGVHLLMEAAEQLMEVIPNLQIRIAGLESMDPDYGPSLRAKHGELISSGRVTFLGGISEHRLDEELRKCSLLCLPSLADSVPMVIAEAMAAGKPVVASCIGGIPEMVQDGITGLLCQPNDPSHLSVCLNQLLSNQGLRSDMGAQARQAALERYSGDTIALATFDAYEQILSEHQNALKLAAASGLD